MRCYLSAFLFAIPSFFQTETVEEPLDEDEEATEVKDEDATEDEAEVEEEEEKEEKDKPKTKKVKPGQRPLLRHTGDF